MKLESATCNVQLLTLLLKFDSNDMASPPPVAHRAARAALLANNAPTMDSLPAKGFGFVLVPGDNDRVCKQQRWWGGLAEWAIPRTHYVAIVMDGHPASSSIRRKRQRFVVPHCCGCVHDERGVVRDVDDSVGVTNPDGQSAAPRWAVLCNCCTETTRQTATPKMSSRASGFAQVEVGA